ncbi:MAG TPA: serine O-acetyltransferase EpsC [Pyrinomonadaceae bacterium]|jgi:serine O-acetyltransferase|nr:serine O-acetyltransferase EpsC [Pyrinomonadaceae bacterium]
MNEKIDRAAKALVESYTAEGVKIHHLDRRPLPSHAELVRVLMTIHELLFPGYIGAQGLTGETLRLHVESRMGWLSETLTEQINRAIDHGTKLDTACRITDLEAPECASEFLARLPHLRRILATDVQAAYEGDPAAACMDEIIFSYPSIYAVMVYRLAHELYKLRVPLIPRIMTEHAHHRTGIDIHPGTRIGSRFFIDHGTGVVIGGTAIIGDNVKLYQGVTLGAFSFDKDAAGQLVRDTKRHPTIEDDVVIYAGATILGGETIIGRGSVIGGNVWLTHSVPPGTRVLQDSPNLRIIPPEEEAVS